MPKDLSNTILISDMDGTLLSADKTICKRNTDAIRKFEEMGGKFTVATGRSTQTAFFYLEELNLKYPGVLFNGGMIYDFYTQKIISEAILPPSYMEVVREVAEEYPHIGIEIVTDNVIYVINYNEIIHDHIGRDQFEYTICEADNLPNHALKILFGVDQDFMDEFSERMVAESYADLCFVRTHKEYFEMLPAGVNKGSAIKQIRELLGGESNQIIGIGDYDNDIELLEQADIGMAVENATEEVKRHADYITCSNDEGAIADAIAYIINN